MLSKQFWPLPCGLMHLGAYTYCKLAKSIPAIDHLSKDYMDRRLFCQESIKAIRIRSEPGYVKSLSQKAPETYVPCTQLCLSHENSASRSLGYWFFWPISTHVCECGSMRGTRLTRNTLVNIWKLGLPPRFSHFIRAALFTLEYHNISLH